MRDLSRVTFALFFLSLALPVQAINPLDVIVNEIAWMGNAQSFSDEWIELYNNTNSPINLDGWTLKAVDGIPEINLAGIIPAKFYYLLERTDETTVPESGADLIYIGALKNSGENLELYDNFGNLIDSIICSSGWFAGDNKTKQTMERKNPFLRSSIDNWATSQNPGGTPRDKNNIITEPDLLAEEPEPKLLSQEESQSSFQQKEKAMVYPSGIVINEILPSPEGPDAEKEWIEIYNQNNFKVSLSGWQIVDLIGQTSFYIFPEETEIWPKGFLVLSRPTTKITLNNDGDSLSLIQPNEKAAETIAYKKAPRGESYNRTGAGWFWSPTPTPGLTNIVPPPLSTIQEIESSKEEPKGPTFKERSKENLARMELATIGEQISESSKSLYIFFIALTLAIFSGGTILIFKRKVKKIDLLKK